MSERGLGRGLARLLNSTPADNLPENEGRTYDWNGHTDMTISRRDLTDEEVAGEVRMLYRDQLNHESVCTMARDRIMCLVKEKAALEARVRQLEAYEPETGIGSWLANRD